MALRQWDICAVHWTHEELDDKVRPALLFSDNETIESGADPLAFIKISTKRYEGVPCLPIGPKDGEEFESTRLDRQTFIHFTAIQDIERRHVLGRIGHAGPATVEMLLELIAEHTGESPEAAE